MWVAMRVWNEPSMSSACLSSIKKWSKDGEGLLPSTYRWHQKGKSVGGFSLLKIAMEWAIL
jgi:hypothetical protein